VDDLNGPVRYLDFGGPADGPVIVCVHGLGGSAVNWTAVAPLMTGTCRVLAPDLAGHGLTQSLGRGTDVASNRALRRWRCSTSRACRTARSPRWGGFGIDVLPLEDPDGVQLELTAPVAQG
jgi:pimeloyl-ACP methyl ester carboxylesterase